MPARNLPFTQPDDRGSRGFGRRFTFLEGPKPEGSGAGRRDDRGDPSKPPTFQMPELRTTNVEPPERDTERRQLQLLVQGLGALGATAGAASDANLLTQIGAGLSRGAGRARQAAEEDYRAQMQAYEDFLADRRAFQRESALEEVQANYRAALTDYRLDREADQAAAERQFETEQAEAERQFEREMSEPTELEQQLTREQISTEKAQQEATRALAERRRAETHERSTAGAALPSSIEATDAKIDALIRREQEALDRGAGNEELGRIQDRILQLKRHRDSLRQGGGTGPPPSRDTTDAGPDMTAPADTTVSGGRRDTTQRDRPGRTPQGPVPPYDATTGGGGGGGTTEPSHGMTLLDPSMGGSGDYDARTTESLVDDALAVAWERSPQEAERRLSGLVEQGRLSPEKRDAVVRRMRRERGAMIRNVEGQSPVAAVIEDAVRLDTLSEGTAAVVANQLKRYAGRQEIIDELERALNARRLSPDRVMGLLDALGYR